MTDDEWTVDEAIDNLKNAMNESGQSTSDLFSSIDANDDGEINGPELYKGLLEHLGDRLSPGQVSMIIKALDSNDDNRIDLSRANNCSRRRGIIALHPLVKASNLSD